MYHWTVHFQTVKPLPTLPRMVCVASETILAPSYAHYGRFRSGETHCLFKYTLKGEGVFSDVQGEHRVKEGMGFLCEICDPECGYYYSTTATEPWTFVWLAFEGGVARQMMRDVISRHGAVLALPRMRDEVERLMAFRKDDGATLSMPPARGARVVTDLLLALAEAQEAPCEEKSEPVLVRRAQQFVTDHIAKNLTVTELAQMLQVSREHLTRTFKEETALTPHDYILRQKLLLACQLLKETSLSNKQIGVKIGYAEPSHFARTFRRVMRMTPSRFRGVGTIPMAWRLAVSVDHLM